VRCGVILAAAILAACAKHGGSTASSVRMAPSSTLTAAGKLGAIQRAPQFGGVKTQQVLTTGTGPTIQAAVDNALQLAIEEVNGTRVGSWLGAGAQPPVQLSEDATPDQIQAYAHWVASRTQGAVESFRIISQKRRALSKVTTEQSLHAAQGPSHDIGAVHASEEDGAKAEAGSDLAEVGEQGAVRGHWNKATGAKSLDYSSKQTELKANWEVKIAAEVATYHEAPSAKRTRVVVAMPDTQATQYQVGQREVAALDLARQIRQSLENALTQSHRFTVLDQQDNADIDQEMAVIRSGQATVADTARLGQRLATDLIVVPTVVQFGYRPHVRHLVVSGRDLAWYTGGGQVDLRVVNATTGQLVLSQSFRSALPSTEPTTLGVSVDGSAMAAQLVHQLDHQMSAAILENTFPPEVLRVYGRQVTINQGGDLIKAGADYHAVYLGKDIVDPQSGVDLGPSQQPCCTIHIDSVTQTMSYGHVIDDGFTAPASFRPGSIELRGMAQVAVAKSHGGIGLPVKQKAAPSKVHKKSKDTKW
jgi:curli biogenesis system outer membrane secretion channel CsgG